jgi:hypothetical protein
VEWNEWNDGDADDPEATHNRDFEPWPPAPLPPHERTWRHPSELGATTVHVVARPQPAMSRKATVVTVAVGVLLVAGAVRMIVPSSSGRTSTSAADTGLSFVTTAIQEVPTAGTEPDPTVATTERPTGTTAPTFTSLRATTTLGANVTSGGPSVSAGSTEVPEFTMVGTAMPTYAVVLDTGRYLATSSVAVNGMDTVDVLMPSGDTAQAVVIHHAGPIALLDLAESSAPPAAHGEPPEAGDVVTVGSPDGEVPATVGEDNEDGYRRLTSEHPLHESGPVYDADGVVVGICTRSQDTAWLVPVLMLDHLAAQQPGTPPVTSTSTSVATSTTSSSSTTSTSTSPPSSTPTTTTLAPSTTKAPATTTPPPTTTPPRTTPAPTSTVPATTG